MKFIVSGRPGAAAPDLVGILAKSGLKACPLRTTRAKLRDGEPGYQFVSEKDARAVPDGDKRLLSISGNGDQSFVLASDMADGFDVLLVEDPNVLKELDPLVGEEPCQLIYVYSDRLLDRKLHFTGGADKPMIAEDLFNRRNDELFDAFQRLEKSLNMQKESDTKPMEMPDCIMRGQGFEYDGNPENLQGFADGLLARLRFHDRLVAIVQEAADMGVLYSKDGMFLLAYEDRSQDRYISADRFAEVLSEDDEGMASVMREYIALSSRFDDLGLMRGETVPADEGDPPDEGSCACEGTCSRGGACACRDGSAEDRDDPDRDPRGAGHM